MLLAKKYSKFISLLLIIILVLVTATAPASAATKKGVYNGKAFTVKTSYVTSKDSALVISSNWDKTTGGDTYSATIVVSDHQKHTSKIYQYNSKRDGASKKIMLPNKALKSNKYTVTVKWKNTPVLNLKQKYTAKISNGSL